MALRDPVQEQVISKFIQRLLSGVSRSAVLKAFPTRTVKRIDLARFRIAHSEAPEKLVQALVHPEGRYRLVFQDYRRADDRGSQSQALFTTLRTKLAREAQAVHRDTGIWMLWLAYPIIYVPHPSPDHEEFLLAPLFLWPIRIDSGNLPEGELILRREQGAPRFNRIAWQWIRRNLEFDAPEPTTAELLQMADFIALREIVKRCCDGFRPVLDISLQPSIQPVPERGSLKGLERPRLLDAGIVGLIQWENMELLADLEKLYGLDVLLGPAGDFLRERERPPASAIEIPEEKNRFLVTDTDHTQERAVWMARRPEGVVIHGPPGTGKSQVIVNIVADALARNERVLVVCQKKAALDVVSSRLRAVGLGDLSIQVDDAEGDRRRIIELLRDQESPSQFVNEQERIEAAEEIERLEKQFKEYSKALFRGRELRRINYRTMIARISRLEREWPGVRPLEALRELFKEINETDLNRLSEALARLEDLFWAANVPENPWVCGKENLSGDRYELEEINADLERALPSANTADSWTGKKGPSCGKLVGTTKEISDAASRLAVTWPRLNLRFARKLGHEQKIVAEIEANQYIKAADAVESIFKKQHSLSRHFTPSFYGNKKTIKVFIALRKWAIASTAHPVYGAIASRAADVSMCEPLLKAVGRWLEASKASLLLEDIRIAKPIAGYLQSLKDYLPTLQVLLRYRATVLGLDKRWKKVVDFIERAPGGPPKNWAKVAELSALLAWAGEAEKEAPILRSLTPELYEADRKRLRELAGRKRELESQTIRSIWAKKWSGVDHRWRRALRFRGPHSQRLREIVETGRTRGLLDLRPCWLANPGTSSQIFPLESSLFDLVIFDEASQCPPEYAVPALFRGKRVVVAGDGKQLPPTMFFKSAFDFEFDEAEEEQGERLEDKVELAISAGAEDLLSLGQARLPDSYLNVHYRSLDPTLISFSNAAFYKNRLEVPRPAIPITIDGKPALFLERVDGVYRTDRTNLEEARRVVDYLKQIWLTMEDRPTIGVVTFNDAQREAIEDLLEAEASRDPEVQAAYERELTRAKDGQDVGFFVKSLEAVQGDERDVILFSTTYGRREDGRFIRSFLGPINRQGGERRLNVAITRARLWVRIFTSLPIAELSSALTPGTVETQDAAGRAMLQLYLAYAERISGGDYAGGNGILRRAMELAGAIGEHQGSAGEEESEFEAEVRDALCDALGCQIDTQVSSGSFRIDLGVRAPDSSNYILGIECDGKAYHSAPSARSYDYWRQTVLEQRGWQIHRIWSSVWRTDRIGEINKVRDRIERILGTDAANKG
ncbi:MAG: DUF4011 domain-containing protein [Proteobacteria bacterium]|nr:DUF4011 domain-containing protein [Pseudomonadota bacterium]